MARKALTDKMVAKIKPGTKRITLPDPELLGHYVRVTPTGAKSFCAVARDPNRKQIWATIGAVDHFTINESRERAREAIRRIKDGKQPFEPPPAKPDSFKAVAENWLKRHVTKKGLRSKGEIVRILNKYIYPAWGDREFTSIRRADVTKLLDTVEDDNGARQADSVLAIASGIMNWAATRSDNYEVPIVRGMRRTSTKDSARDRFLDDDEIRQVWKQAEADGKFGAFIRLALLTGQRRAKVAAMRWEDVSVDGIWKIPSEKQEKGTPGELMLPETALDIIRAQNRIVGNPYVLAAARGDGHFCGWSPTKRAFDEMITKANGGEPLKPWTIHDLRRTARTLMSRAKVQSEIAERVLGHTPQGVEGTYDRFEYPEEKADALNRLATLIDNIVDPPWRS